MAPKVLPEYPPLKDPWPTSPDDEHHAPRPAIIRHSQQRARDLPWTQPEWTLESLSQEERDRVDAIATSAQSNVWLDESMTLQLEPKHPDAVPLGGILALFREEERAGRWTRLRPGKNRDGNIHGSGDHGEGEDEDEGQERSNEIETDDDEEPDDNNPERAILKALPARSQGPTKSGRVKEAPAKTCTPISGDDPTDYKNFCLRNKTKGGMGDQNEPLVFAYAGYGDRADGRRWALTPPFLNAIDAFFTAGGSKDFPVAMQIYDSGVDGWQKHDRSLQWAKSEWPVQLKPTSATFELSFKVNAHSMLAFLMYWLPKESDRYMALSLEDQKTEYKAVKLNGDLWLPPWETVSANQFVSPVWNHAADLFPVAEKCSRGYGILRAIWTKIAKVTFTEKKPSTPTKRWHAYWYCFWSNPKLLESSEIPAACKPMWMQDCPGYSANRFIDLDAPPAEPGPERSPRNIVFVMPTRSGHARFLEIEKDDADELGALEENRRSGIFTSSVKYRTQYDPRAFREDQWRDLIRLELSLETEHKSIVRIAVVRHDEEGFQTPVTFHLRDSSSVAMTWKQFQEEVDRTELNTTIQVELTLRYHDAKYWRSEMEYHED